MVQGVAEYNRAAIAKVPLTFLNSLIRLTRRKMVKSENKNKPFLIPKYLQNVIQYMEGNITENLCNPQAITRASFLSESKL